MPSRPIHTAIQPICSSDILDRLISRFDLPEQYVNDKREVASVSDFHIRSLERYEKLRDVFDHGLKGADLILAVHKFRSLYSSFTLSYSIGLLYLLYRTKMMSSMTKSRLLWKLLAPCVLLNVKLYSITLVG